MVKQGGSKERHTWWGERSDECCQALVDGLNRNRHAHFIAADSGGRIIGCTDAMARLLGLSADKTNDISIWDKLTESDVTRLNERLRQIPFSADPILLNFVTPNQIPITLECGLALMSQGRFVIIGLPARSSAEDSAD